MEADADVAASFRHLSAASRDRGPEIRRRATLADSRRRRAQAGRDRQRLGGTAALTARPSFRSRLWCDQPLASRNLGHRNSSRWLEDLRVWRALPIGHSEVDLEAPSRRERPGPELGCRTRRFARRPIPSENARKAAKGRALALSPQRRLEISRKGGAASKGKPKTSRRTGVPIRKMTIAFEP
jgi:hypothetical protein